MDRYNNYFQCVIFVLAVTISHTDTPTTEDTPQHRDRVKAKLHARGASKLRKCGYLSIQEICQSRDRTSIRPPTHPPIRLHHRATNLKCYAWAWHFFGGEDEFLVQRFSAISLKALGVFWGVGGGGGEGGGGGG